MMSIRGIGQYGGFYQNYNVPSIPSASVETTPLEQPSELQKSSPLDASQMGQTTNETSATESNRQNSSLEDISLLFNKNDNFDYIGKDSEIGNLDVQKAVSDMKKDQVLQEYQYFVGDMFSQGASQFEDGRVFVK